MKYLIVTISAEDKEQADKILNSLLEKKLVTGGLLITDMDYMNINSYTTEANKKAIIEDVRKTSVEGVPMITFTEFGGNEELLK